MRLVTRSTTDAGCRSGEGTRSATWSARPSVAPVADRGDGRAPGPAPAAPAPDGGPAGSDGSGPLPASRVSELPVPVQPERRPGRPARQQGGHPGGGRASTWPALAVARPASAAPAARAAGPRGGRVVGDERATRSCANRQLAVERLRRAAWPGRARGSTRPRRPTRPTLGARSDDWRRSGGLSERKRSPPSPDPTDTDRVGRSPTPCRAGSHRCTGIVRSVVRGTAPPSCRGDAQATGELSAVASPASEGQADHGTPSGRRRSAAIGAVAAPR